MGTQDEEVLSKDVLQELDKAVAAPHKQKEQATTFVGVLLNQLQEVAGNTGVTYTQEVLIPVPEKAVTDEVQDAKSFVKLAGKINRDESLPVEVNAKTEQVLGKNGKDVNIINFVFEFDNPEDAEEVIDYVQSKTKKENNK